MLVDLPFLRMEATLGMFLRFCTYQEIKANEDKIPYVEPLYMKYEQNDGTDYSEVWFQVLVDETIIYTCLYKKDPCMVFG